jgi:4-oxalocrotonate tautomerase
MPIVRIEMLPGRSLAQKRELARVITEAMRDIAQAEPEDTLVLFGEYSIEDWASGGRLRVDQVEDEANVE